MKSQTMDITKPEKNYARGDASQLQEEPATHADRALDEALVESFPASDPVAISIASPIKKAKPLSKPIRKRQATRSQKAAEKE